MTIGDDEDIFENAMSGEPAKEPEPQVEAKPEAEPNEPAETPEQEERPRDPATGKFAKKQPDEKPEAEAKPEAEPEVAAEAEPQPERRGAIPPARLREEADARRRAEQERDQERQSRETLQRQLQDMQRQIEQLRSPPRQEEQPEPPDPWADPQAFRDFGVRQALTPLEQKVEEQRLAFSEMLARDKFGDETVNSAFTALEQAMSADPQARFEHQRIMAAKNPYVELVNWHKRQSAIREIGDDPSAYKARLREELLKDPEFVKSVIEGAREQAQQPAPNGQRSTSVNLPPSLNRTTGSGGQATTPAPKNDAEIYQELFPQ